jgi:hypothetical protein
MTDDVTAQPAGKIANIGAMIASGGAIVAAACALISTIQTLKVVQTDAQQRLFGLKLEACDSFSATMTTISANPMLGAMDADKRGKAILNANRLTMLFPDQVKKASLNFINQMDIVFADKNGGPRDVPTAMKLGALMQSAVELSMACQNDIQKTVEGLG